MKIAYFDTFSGISGDMTLGAFVSAGLPIDALAEAIGTMKLPGVELQARHLQRNGIGGVNRQRRSAVVERTRKVSHAGTNHCPVDMSDYQLG